MNALHRYWFSFEKFDRPTPLNLGCGVTAFDYDDAIKLLNERIFSSEKFPRIVNCIADIDVSTLDPNHVLPNLGLVSDRGIWFPMGY
jgi:hypothetical protein